MTQRHGENVAVIIPTLNEAQRLQGTLDHARRLGFPEIIVADGGSTDATQAIARSNSGVRLVVAQPGRGQQVAAGLDHAASDWALVLHADTRLPANAREAITATLSDADVAGGCFRLTFETSNAVLKLSAWATRFDTSLTTFGDQAMFFDRAALFQAGGMRKLPLFEDVELRGRLRRVGRFVKLGQSVTTSPRGFGRHGALLGQIRNALLLTAYFAGVSPERLARLYRGHKKTRDG